MATLITFIASGIMIIILVAAKVWEEKSRKSFFLLRLISKGDSHFREFSQNAAHMYADLKEKAGFVIGRQLPLHTRNFTNKTVARVQEKSKKYMGDLKEGNFFGRKNEGISEFLKDIRDMEEDNEALNNGEEKGSQNDKIQVK